MEPPQEKCLPGQSAAVCQSTVFSASLTRLFKVLEALSGDLEQPPVLLDPY